MLYGALEAGGTKMVCAVGDENGKILEQISVPTTSPDETMPQVLEYFKGKEIEALGIACFGPVGVNKNIPDSYGHILATPKITWRFYDIVGIMKKELSVPVGFDTDVNGSLLGEATWGAARGLTDAVYITIGTGVGAGIMSNGRLIHGMLHPEVGHMKLVPLPTDSYKGYCIYHGTCFEGMVCGPAIEERFGAPGKALADRDDVWELVSAYIAQALRNLIVIVSPQIIILGGGVMHQTQLFPLIRQKVKEELAGYVKSDEFDDIDHYIVPADLNDDQGIMGCIKLAMDAEHEEVV